jgi:hypothetical protein
VTTGNKELAKTDYQYVLFVDPNNSEAKAGIAALAIETRILKDARTFLSDLQKFVASQSSVSQIDEIAREAALLRIAIDNFDETAASQSVKALGDLLEPIGGFKKFLFSRKSRRNGIEMKPDAAPSRVPKRIKMFILWVNIFV